MLDLFLQRDYNTLAREEGSRTERILYYAAFAAAGVAIGAAQGALLYVLLKKLTSAVYAAAALIAAAKLAVYAACAVIMVLFFKGGLIAFGGGLGAGIFVSACLASLISIKNNG